MKVLLAAAALLLSTAYNSNANTTLTGVITIYDQTSGAYAKSISTPNCNATNGGCSSFTPNITSGSSGSGEMSWSVGAYDVVESGFFSYNNHFNYPDGVASIAECQWNIKIYRNSNTSRGPARQARMRPPTPA